MEITYEKLFIDEKSIFHFQEFKQPRFTSPFHLHDEYELILIKKSHGKLYIGNQVINFSDGDIFLFAPQLPHCFYNTRGYEKGNKQAHAFVIQFRKNFLGEHFFEKTEVSHFTRLVNKSIFGVQFVNPSKAIQKRIQLLNKKRDLERIGEFIHLVNHLSVYEETILLNTENNLNLRNLTDSKIINDVFKYVAENFQKTISFKEAANVANMQESAFCRYFKRKTKKKFSEFVNETRIMHARKLLTETDKTIIEIAFECGYENTSYFNRQFKLNCKTSPTVFRKLLIQNV